MNIWRWGIKFPPRFRPFGTQIGAVGIKQGRNGALNHGLPFESFGATRFLNERSTFSGGPFLAHCTFGAESVLFLAPCIFASNRLLRGICRFQWGPGAWDTFLHAFPVAAFGMQYANNPRAHRKQNHDTTISALSCLYNFTYQLLYSCAGEGFMCVSACGILGLMR